LPRPPADARFVAPLTQIIPLDRRRVNWCGFASGGRWWRHLRVELWRAFDLFSHRQSCPGDRPADGHDGRQSDRRSGTELRYWVNVLASSKPVDLSSSSNWPEDPRIAASLLCEIATDSATAAAVMILDELARGSFRHLRIGHLLPPDGLSSSTFRGLRGDSDGPDQTGRSPTVASECPLCPYRGTTSARIEPSVPGSRATPWPSSASCPRASSRVFGGDPRRIAERASAALLHGICVAWINHIPRCRVKGSALYTRSWRLLTGAC
jgi:hypothetical protein